MFQKMTSEKGQTMILLVISIAVLLGFAALAVDGGMIYSDRRHAQNAADAASLAGALQKANGADNSVVATAANNSAIGNGFDPSQLTVEVSEMDDFSGHYFLVEVVLTTTTDTNFLDILYSGPMTNRLTAVSRVRLSQPALPGTAIVALDNCLDGTPALLWYTGGGNSGGIQTYQGGMFVNSPENPGNVCNIDPGNNGYGIWAEPPWDIYSVGSYDYAGDDMIFPVPIEDNTNGNIPIDDPLAGLPEPQCNDAGYEGPEGVFHPGNWNGADLDAGTYERGIYCINGLLKISGNDGIIGSGLVLYFKNDGMSFTGNGGLGISAPDASNCLGVDGDPTASCTYQGIAIFAARTNTHDLDIRGNGGDAVYGMIYAINAPVVAKGGGTDPDDTSVVGQIICGRVEGRGNGSFMVTYNAGHTYRQPTRIGLEE